MSRLPPRNMTLTRIIHMICLGSISGSLQHAAILKLPAVAALEPGVRRDVLVRYHRRSLRGVRPAVVSFVLIGVIPLLLQLALMLLLPAYFQARPGRIWLRFLPHLIAMALGIEVLGYLQLSRAKRLITQDIGRNCLRCGYDLRATPVRCPECGLDTSDPQAPSCRS